MRARLGLYRGRCVWKWGLLEGNESAAWLASEHFAEVALHVHVEHMDWESVFLTHDGAHAL